MTQKTAWFLAHRIRKAFAGENDVFTGPMEVDETYMGGKRANMPKAKRAGLTGRSAVGKTAVVGAKEPWQKSCSVVGRTKAGDQEAEGLLTS